MPGTFSQISIKNILKKSLRIAAGFVAGLVITSLLLSLLLLIPSVQTFVTKKITATLSNMTRSRIEVKAVHIAFPKTVRLGGIFVEDRQGDTLAYCNKIDIDIAIFPLLRKKILLDHLVISGLAGNLVRSPGDSTFNYSALISAFSNEEDEKSTTVEDTTKPWSFDIGQVLLEDIAVKYADFPESIFYNLNLGSLKISANHLDLAKMDFDLEEIIISTTTVSIIQPQDTVAEKTTIDESVSLLPKIRLKRFDIADTRFDYKTSNEKMVIQAFIKHALIAPEIIDLQNELVYIDHFFTDSIHAAIRMITDSTLQQTDQSPERGDSSLNSNFTFGDFGWDIKVNQTEILQSNFSIDLDEKQIHADSLDFAHLSLTNFNLRADDLAFDKNRAAAHILNLSLSERSGAQIKRLSTNFLIDNNRLSIKSLDFSTGKTTLSGDANITYPALSEMDVKLSELGLEVDMQAEIEISEVEPFTGFFSQNPSLGKIKHFKIGKLKLDGLLSDLNIHEMRLSAGDSTLLHFSAQIKGLPSENIAVDYVLTEFRTTDRDLANLMTTQVLPAELVLPKFIRVSSEGQTDLSNGFILLNAETDIGSLALDLNLNDNNLAANLLLDQLDVGALLADTTFGTLTLKSQLHGTLLDFVPKAFTSSTEVLSLHWNEHLFQDMQIEVNLEQEKYSYMASLNDSVLSFLVNGTYFESDSIENVAIDIDIKALELSALKLSESPLTSSAQVSFNAAQKSREEVSANLQISDLWLIKPDDRFFVDEINAEAFIDNETKDFYFRSPVFDASLKGNTGISELRDALIDHIDLYIELPDSIVSEKDFVFEFDLEMKNPAILSFLLEDLQSFELEKCSAKYFDAQDIMTAEIDIRDLHYKDIQVKNLEIFFDTQPDSAAAGFRFGELSAGSVSLKKFGLDAGLQKELITTRFYTLDQDDNLKYELSYLIRQLDSIYQVSIDPDRLLIDYNRWSIPQDNLLQIEGDLISARSAMISFEDQKIGLDPIDKGFSLVYENFQLQNLGRLFEEDSIVSQMNGLINGAIQFPGLLTSKPGLVSILNISDLRIGTSLIGDFHSDLRYFSGEALNIDARLVNNENSIHVIGQVPSSGAAQNLSIVAEADIQNAGYFKPLFSNYLSKLEGKLNGRVFISGAGSAPRINGFVDFRNLDMITIETNTRFNTIGGIKIDNNLLVFDQLSIQDHLEKSMNISGRIDIRDFNDPIFDVKLRAGEFLIMNSERHRNEMVEGKLNLSIDMMVSGRKSKLKVTNNMKILQGTDIYYTFPGNELELITDEGIVEYTVFEEKDIDLTFIYDPPTVDDSLKTLLKGIDFSAQLEIDPGANFTITIDPTSGDYTKFNLQGKLLYTYSDARSGTLNGALVFAGGFYELSFYELVKKRFDFMPGSSVSWSGEIMEGDLNFGAKYTVRTNSVGLVSNEISTFERSMYNQRLPYDVILKVENKISDPEVSFFLDLPERHRSSYPTLDTKLNYLNQPAMESERNKQVFALLVGGTFIPEDPGITEGSGGANFATTAARNSINAIMTQQLNNLTGKIIVGVDMDLGLNTFDDYSGGSAQSRTQLDVKVSKNLFNDRVTAEMESHINLDGSPNQVGQQSTAGMNEFAVSYKLTKSGNYRVKAFSENAYDIYDGEIQKSGIAFIFVKEFDRFKKKQEPELPAESDDASNDDQNTEN